MKPKKPLLGYLLYKYLNIETSAYRSYQDRYLRYMRETIISKTL